MRNKGQQHYSSEADAKEKLIVYVYEYLIHSGAKQAAETFKENIGYTKEIKVNEGPGFLIDWWCVFWDLYCAAPERRHTQPESSNDAKSFHDFMRQSTPLTPSVTQTSPQNLPPQQQQQQQQQQQVPPQYRPRMHGPPQPGPSPQHIKPSPQHIKPSPQHIQPSPQHIQPSPQHIQPSPQHIQPSPQHIQPSPQHIQPSPQHIQPSPQHIQPSPQHIQPSPQHIQPSPQHIQPSPQHIQPSPQHMQPSPQHMQPSPGSHPGVHQSGFISSGGPLGPPQQHQGMSFGPTHDIDQIGQSPGFNRMTPVAVPPGQLSQVGRPQAPMLLQQQQQQQQHHMVNTSPHSQDEYVIPVAFSQDPNDQSESAEILKLKQSMQEDTTKMFEKEQSEFNLGDYSDGQNKWQQ